MADYLYEFRAIFALPDLTRLFAQTDWTARRTPDGLQAMIDHSVCLGVWHDGRLIGFARAVTDDIYRAFIEDVIVDEAYRGQGVGREIMRRLGDRLSHVEEVILASEDHLIPFYEQFGFVRFDQAHMHIWRGG